MGGWRLTFRMAEIESYSGLSEIMDRGGNRALFIPVFVPVGWPERTSSDNSKRDAAPSISATVEIAWHLNPHVPLQASPISLLQAPQRLAAL